MDPVTIPAVEGSGSAKYFGNLVASRQDWIDTGDFRLSAVELFTDNWAELSENRGSTGYPRKNLLYSLFMVIE